MRKNQQIIIVVFNYSDKKSEQIFILKKACFDQKNIRCTGFIEN